MNKILLIGALFLYVSASHANGDANPKAIVSLLSFECPKCNQMEQCDSILEGEVVGKGVRFARAPVPLNDITNLSQSRFYFSARLYNPEIETAVRAGLFNMNHKGYVDPNNVEEIVTWFEMINYRSDIKWAEIADLSNTDGVIESLARLANFVSKAQQLTLDVPSWFLIDKGSVSLVSTGIQPCDELINKVKGVL